MHLIPHRFQENTAIRVALRRAYGVFAEPGMGKTVIALRAIQIIKPERVLIIAPRLVAWNTWPSEIAKWEEFCDLTYTIIHKAYKFDPSAQIHLVNPEGLKSDIIKKTRYDMLIVDESTLFKSAKSQRFRRAYKIAKRCAYRIVMTGCPIPHDYIDLWSQFKLIDFGETLYPKIGQYRTRYFNAVPKRVSADLTIDTYEIKSGADEEIKRTIKPRCIALDAKGSIPMPDLVTTDIPVTLSEDEQRKYNMFEKELFAEIKGKELISFSAGSKYSRCHQLANGACYDDSKVVLELHTKKIEALANLINEMDGEPLLVAYRFEHDISRIMQHIGKAHRYRPSDIDRWNDGKIKVLCAQYQTMSHGLNLQYGGQHLCCFSLTDNFDWYYQMVRRLYRQGAKYTTFVHRIVTKDTVDQAIVTRLDRHQNQADNFIESLKAYEFLKKRGMQPAKLPPRVKV